MGGEAFDGELPGDAQPLVVLVGLVEQDFGVGVAADGGVDLGLPLAALFPPAGQQRR